MSDKEAPEVDSKVFDLEDMNAMLPEEAEPLTLDDIPEVHSEEGSEDDPPVV